SKNIFVTKYGIFWSVVAGILISAYCITLFKSFTLGPVSFIVPIVYGVTLILTSFGGVILFKEALSGGEILGISLVVLGILIIGISRYQTA
ncbi:MAG: hypothetical protein N2654_08100, partial [Deltaproteobacteria bacterium]|nr:hypothetical protein [Deltaproteobacteria bacterium]